MLQTAMPSSERGGGGLSPHPPRGAPTSGAPTSGGGGGARDGAPNLSVREQAASLRPVVRAVVACVLGEHRDHADVDDCTSEVLRRALEGSSRLRDGEPVRPWLLGIARHVAIDVRRRRRRERPMDGPADADEETESWVDRIVDPSPGPDDHAATREQARRVQTALGALATQQREALILFHVEGEDYQRISARLGVPMGTVATWLSRGRKALVEALGAPSTSAVSASKPAARET